MTVTVDTVLAFFNVQFPQFTAQTKVERDAGEKTTPAYLSYNNFYTYWGMANTRLSVDLAAHDHGPIGRESVFSENHWLKLEKIHGKTDGVDVCR